MYICMHNKLCLLNDIYGDIYISKKMGNVLFITLKTLEIYT